MARPTLRTLVSGIVAWDADADVNFNMIVNAPFPMYLATDLSTLTSSFAPASYTGCFALADPADPILYISDGTDWVPYITEATAVPDSEATTAADLADDFNDLLASLQAAGHMAT